MGIVFNDARLLNEFDFLVELIYRMPAEPKKLGYPKVSVFRADLDLNRSVL